jgi:membrane protease YdiL (CAAX protease family)
LKDRGLAAVRWLLGELVDRPREPDSGKLVVLVAYAAAIGMWFGVKHGYRGDPVLAGAWRMAAHGGVPLIGLALWELRTLPKGPWRNVAIAAVLGVVVVIGARFTDAGVLWHTEAPVLHLAAPLLGLGTLTLLALRHGGADLSRWGIGLGDWRWWLPHHGVLLATLVPVLMVTTWLVKPLADYYPTYKPARTSLDAFAFSHFGIALDFIGWEFLFRGFLLFAMARRGDALVAVLVQVFPFFILHQGKPEIEFTSSFVGGIFAGWFCLRAGSFFPLFVIHLTMISTVGFTSFMMRNYGW